VARHGHSRGAADAGRRRGHVAVAAFAFGVLATVAAAMALAMAWARVAPAEPGILPPDGELALVPRLAGVTMAGALEALWYHLQSLFGVFVWGHSAYARAVYGLLDALWVACTVIGVAASARRSPSRGHAVLAGGVLGAMLGCQVMLAIAIAQQGPASIFGLVRLSSPGLAALMAPMYLAVRRGLERPATRPWIHRGVCAWLLVLGIHYLPLFFIGHLL
jgi:hypothetical protein